MISAVERLLILQELDNRIMKLQREALDIPARKQGLAAAAEHQLAVSKSSKEALTARQVQMRKLELQVESERQVILKLRQQQLELKSNKEFKAMEEEIKGVERKITDIEDQELRLMAEVEAAAGAVDFARKDIEKAEGLAAQEIAVLSERENAIRRELEALAPQRQAAATEVDPLRLKRYEMIFENREGRALVKVLHGVCSGCNMTLPPQIIHDVRKDGPLVFCSHCGRMLCA